MQTILSQDISRGSYIITAYSADGVYINDVLYQGNVLLTPDEIIQATPIPPTPAQIPLWLARLKTSPEVIIFGMGDKTQFLPLDIQYVFLQERIGIEMMTTAAACRTYNVLAHEGRKVMLVI